MLTVAFALAAVAAEPVGSKLKWAPLNQAQSTQSKSQDEQQAPVRPVQAPASSVSRPATQPASDAAAPAPVVAAPVAVTSAVQGRLDLTCFGGGTANKVTAATAWSNAYASGTVGTTPWSGSGHGTTTVHGMRQQAFGDQVDIRLFSGDDRIRMPRTMLPAFRGGKDGWFKLKNVMADARSIRASAAVNFMNNPKVFIDRVTGTVSISGKAGDYAGQCQIIDTSAAPKF